MSDDAPVRQNAERFARQHVEPHLHPLDHYPDEPLPAGLLPGLASLGLGELDTRDGEGLGLLAAAVRSLATTAAAPAAIVLADALARSLPAPSPEGRLGAFPLYADPDRPAHRLALRRGSSGLEVAGRVPLVANAPVSDFMLLPAADAGDPEASYFVQIDTARPEVSIGPPLLTLGMRGCPTADVVVTDAHVDSDRCARLDMRALARFFGPAVALLTGVAEASLHAATLYARERIQGGRPIIEHGEVRSMLAEMSADQSMCDMASRCLRAGGEVDVRTALALLLRAREAVIRVAHLGVQVLGGNGYMEDYGQERRLRDARQGGCLLGRPDVLRMAVADRL